MNRAVLAFLLAVAAVLARSARLGRPRRELVADDGGEWTARPRSTETRVAGSTARVWITDGSLPVFDDTTQLRTSHPALAGLRTRYEGFVDPSVARGSLEIARERRADALFVEAEWYVGFPDGIPLVATPQTPIVLQGLIEGKWMNRLLGTRAWQPASLGNNVIAAGPGIRTTFGALEGDDLAGEARIEYESERAGRRTHVTRAADLRGHNVAALVQEVLSLGQELDGVDLGALGPESAVVNEKERVLTATLPVPLAHRVKERLVWRALAEGLGIKPGTGAKLTVRNGEGAIVGEAALLLTA